MRALPRTHGAAELLDEPGHDPAELAASLDHVAAVNRWLGGERATLRALLPRLRPGLRILDVGTGNGSIPIALVRAARRRGVPVAVTGLELHPQTRAIAERHCAAYPEIRIEAGDALALPFADDAFNVVLFTLLLHHLDDAAATVALREAARTAPVVIVNELHRTYANYAGAQLLAATAWRGNRITRHDGPLSVLRAYRGAELLSLARGAGLRVHELRRRWFYRLVLVAGRA